MRDPRPVYALDYAADGLVPTGGRASAAPGAKAAVTRAGFAALGAPAARMVLTRGMVRAHPAWVVPVASGHPWAAHPKNALFSTADDAEPRSNPPKGSVGIPRFLGVGARRIAYPRDLHADPRFQRALAATRASTIYGMQWDKWVAWYRESSDAEIQAYIEEREANAARRAAREVEQAEIDRWESQAFEVPVPKPQGGYRGKFDGALVWMYHGTSSVLLPDILRHGLLAQPPKQAWDSTTRGWVYLTASASARGCGAADYAKKAVYQFGGEPVVLRVIVPWRDLSPDLDDSDISCGRYQWRTRSDVPPAAIFEVDGEHRRGTLDRAYVDAMRMWGNAHPRTPGRWLDAPAEPRGNPAVAEAPAKTRRAFVTILHDGVSDSYAVVTFLGRSSAGRRRVEGAAEAFALARRAADDLLRRGAVPEVRLTFAVERRETGIEIRRIGPSGRIEATPLHMGTRHNPRPPKARRRSQR